MFDRNKYWFTRLHELICQSPGITWRQLVTRSRKLTDNEREGFLFQLRDAGKIRIAQKDLRGGNVCSVFWPLAQPPASPIDQLAKLIDDVRRHVAAAHGAIEAAAFLADEISAADAKPDTTATSGVETATMPEYGLRTAG